MSEWRDYLPQVEKLATQLGLSFNPVDFEAVPQQKMPHHQAQKEQ